MRQSNQNPLARTLSTQSRGGKFQIGEWKLVNLMISATNAPVDVVASKIRH
jgi:hypothetical protein